MEKEFYFATGNLLVWRPRETLDNAKICAFLDYLERVEATRPPSFDRFADFSLTTGISISYSEVSEYAVRRRSYAAAFLPQPAKSAFYAVNPVTYGMARMYQNLLDCERLDIRIFQILDEVAAWLDVDLSLLATA